MAQTFPADEDFAALKCGDLPMTDLFRDEPGAIEDRDLVGLSGAAAGYHADDDEFLYLRLRLDRDPAPGGTTQNHAWGVEIDVNDDRRNYEILVMVDGVSRNVLLLENTTTTSPDDPTDPAETTVATYDFSTHGRSTAAGETSFGDDGDFFLTFAVPWSDLTNLGLDRGDRLEVWAASSSTNNSLNGDFACHDGASGDPSLAGVRDGDSDGDGNSDADEVAGGTDPRDPDSYLILAGGAGCTAAGGASPVFASAFAVLVLMVGSAARRRRRR